MGASVLVFYLIAAAVIAAAMVVTFARNLVYSAFALLGVLTGTAALYIYLHADFLAATQVIVYIGGIAVLFLFAVMLTHHIEKASRSNLHFGLKTAIPLGVVVTGLAIYAVLTHDWPVRDLVLVNPTVHRIGDAFLRSHLLPFEFASVILLVVLVGAALVARREIQTRTARAGGVRTTGDGIAEASEEN